MHGDLSLKETFKEWHGSLKAYLIGFLASLLLTGTSFLIAIYKELAGEKLTLILASLALMQAIVQLKFFLHVGDEPKPKWETLVFFFMVLILFIIAAGSLWIMYDLNQRMM